MISLGIFLWFLWNGVVAATAPGVAAQDAPHRKVETLITRYAETLIRRTFGTEDAMKLAKPVPKEKEETSYPGKN